MQKLTFEEKIYTYHIDFVGHVNNIVYIQWLENARIKLIEAMGLSVTQLAEAEDILPIITETYIKYKKPFYLDDKVQIEVWVSDLFNISVNFKFRFLNKVGEVCSVAQQKVLFIDKFTMRPSRKIAKYKENFERFFVAE